jgi:hypothetical protein
LEVGDGAGDPFVAAFRFWVLLVLPRPKPWRLKMDTLG